MIRRWIAVAALVVVAGVWLCTTTREPTLYVGGPILTMDRVNPLAEALAVEGDRIALVDREDELRRWAARRGARIVDLQGRTLMPGFIDAHGHFPGQGVEAMAADLTSPPVGEVRTIDELVARLRERAEAEPDREWIVGFGYDDTLLAEKRHPRRDDLDRVSTDRPVVAFHVSGHLAAANGAALAALGLTADTPDPEGGLIRRDPTSGEPDGVLEETAMEPLLEHLQKPGLRDAWAMLRLGIERSLAAGVTTVQVGHAGPMEVRALPWLARLRQLPVRVVIWPGEPAALALESGELSFSTPDPDRVRLGAVKLVADGSIQGYTGYLSEPYFTPPGDDPTYRGYPRIPRDALFEKVAHWHAAGHQLAIHGNGDASIDDILDAWEAALAASPRADARPVLVHAQMARPDQLARMAALGVVPSFFALHTYYWGDRHRDVFLGPERAARISPAATAQALGVRFTLHCDTPVVPLEPLRLVWAAVNRITASGAPLGPEERIDVLSALRAVTIDAAWQHFEEASVGSLEPGKLADLVILDRNPLDDPEHVDRIRVLETIVGGETVWRADDEGDGR